MKIKNIEMQALPSFGFGDAVFPHLLAVLVQGPAGVAAGRGDLAVYQGLVAMPSPDACRDILEWNARRDAIAEHVAARGCKLTYEQSKAYFKGIKERDYRA